MNNLSFNIKTSLDFYEKLVEDHDEFTKNDTSSRIALNCAMTAWHLTEWVYHEYKDLLPNSINKLSDLQSQVKNLCKSLQIMHDLSNGTKHFKLDRHVPDVINTKLHNGAFSSAFSRDFDISSLIISMKDGQKLYFGDEIQKCLEFWRDYIEDLEQKTQNS